MSVAICGKVIAYMYNRCFFQMLMSVRKQSDEVLLLVRAIQAVETHQDIIIAFALKATS